MTAFYLGLAVFVFATHTGHLINLREKESFSYWPFTLALGIIVWVVGLLGWFGVLLSVLACAGVVYVWSLFWEARHDKIPDQHFVPEDKAGREISALRRIGSQSAQRKNGKQRKVSGKALDTIQFCYVDANGEFSEREVIVKVITDDYFNGYCKASMAGRTFRLDRVQGNITSKETGEILDPFTWSLRF